jgi:hypothetical protein
VILSHCSQSYRTLMFEKILNKIFRRKFHGLEIQKKDAETLFLKINADTTEQIIDEFLTSLPNKYQVNFFDNSYPQISDPGAYVWTQRLVDDKYAYSLHNHGWSSEWKQISKSELVKYIYSNRLFNSGNFKIYPYQKKAELGKIIGKY